MPHPVVSLFCGDLIFIVREVQLEFSSIYDPWVLLRPFRGRFARSGRTDPLGLQIQQAPFGDHEVGQGEKAIQLCLVFRQTDLTLPREYVPAKDVSSRYSRAPACARAGSKSAQFARVVSTPLRSFVVTRTWVPSVPLVSETSMQSDSVTVPTVS